MVDPKEADGKAEKNVITYGVLSLAWTVEGSTKGRPNKMPRYKSFRSTLNLVTGDFCTDIGRLDIEQATNQV